MRTGMIGLGRTTANLARPRVKTLDAIDEAALSPALGAALVGRFALSIEADFANQVLPALRHAYSGRLKTPAEDNKTGGRCRNDC